MTKTHNPPRLIEADPSTGSPRIYLACLAAYNAGMLHGVWVSATHGEDHIRDAVRAMLACSPVPEAEEWALHDYEGFDEIHLSEYASFETVCDIAAFIENHETLGAKLIANFSGEIEEARAALENYAGAHKSLGAFAEELTEETGTPIPDHIALYVDYDAMGRDMELGGDVFTLTLGFEDVHVFWSR